MEARGDDRMKRTVAQKMGLKEKLRSYIVNAPASAIASMHLPRLKRANSLRGNFDYLHLFVKTQAEMDREFPRLVRHLQPDGKLWISWPKGGRFNTDLTLPHVIRIGYSHGMVESTTLSIDPTWSGMKFTRPKPGKRYQNSFGKLS